MSVSDELLCSFELLKPLDSTALKLQMKKSRNRRSSMMHQSPVCSFRRPRMELFEQILMFPSPARAHVCSKLLDAPIPSHTAITNTIDTTNYIDIAPTPLHIHIPPPLPPLHHPYSHIRLSIYPPYDIFCVVSVRLAPYNMGSGGASTVLHFVRILLLCFHHDLLVLGAVVLFY